MAKVTISLPIHPLVLLFLFFNSGILKLTNAQGTTWCVAKPSSSDAELVANIEYACSNINGAMALASMHSARRVCKMLKRLSGFVLVRQVLHSFHDK
ncbi:hypothetical protein Patl1_10159 [Pistacia atlantica]|uniref:Uncharacterized protein n=1 Tax=Pistacia atlantica TaxID=434234 RepID=A0ACC1A1H9_9ROSI|nr:hypothetical protein Patl1_10159 [Pistacia atlantica]